jgi:RNA polymerase sigma-70 factor (ECF subfamily)
VVASLTGFLGDLGLAEEATADAFEAAARKWPADGVPDNPAGWLVVTAHRKAIDRLRRERVLEGKLRLLEASARGEQSMGPGEIPDERLELIFLCCHPALAQDAQVALTLRAVAGLSTEQIARAFLVPAETMKRRLTRAKTKIKTAGIPFRRPPERLLADRLAAALAVLYLIFNAGYITERSGPDLASEAISLARVLAGLLPGEPEVRGLLALMLAHDSRRDARMRGADLVLLPDQDRSLWRWEQIAEARSVAGEPRGPYAIQAAIALLQTAERIDWARIAGLYAELFRQTGSPVVRLAGAVAIAETQGPQIALAVVDELNLDGYQYWHSTRGELLRRLGRDADARLAYEAALALAGTEPERRYLRRRIDCCR